MSFDKATLKNISADISKALESVGVKYGIKIENGRCQYSDNNFTMKLEASRVNSDGTVETKEVSDFKKNCQHYGLKISDLGKTFVSNGQTYVLSGLNTRAKSMPIMGHRLGDPKAQYKFRESVVAKIKSNTVQQPTAQIDTDNLPAHILALLKK